MTATAWGPGGMSKIKADSWRKSILLLGIRQEALLRLAPQLRQAEIEVVTARDAHSALEICAARRVELVVIRHPVDGITIDELMTRLRRTGSRSRLSYVLVLTESASDEVLRKLAGRNSRFVNSSDFGVILSVVARQVLGVARRVGSRLMVQIELWMSGTHVSHFCQVINISETGMLVRTGDRPELHEVVEVTFTLPDMPQPIHTSARVARHTDPREPEGVALEFIDLDRATRGLIRAHIGAQLKSQTG